MKDHGTLTVECRFKVGLSLQSLVRSVTACNPALLLELSLVCVLEIAFTVIGLVIFITTFQLSPQNSNGS